VFDDIHSIVDTLLAVALWLATVLLWFNRVLCGILGPFGAVVVSCCYSSLSFVILPSLLWSCYLIRFIDTLRWIVYRRTLLACADSPVLPCCCGDAMALFKTVIRWRYYLRCLLMLLLLMYDDIAIVTVLNYHWCMEERLLTTTTFRTTYERWTSDKHVYCCGNLVVIITVWSILMYSDCVMIQYYDIGISWYLDMLYSCLPLWCDLSLLIYNVDALLLREKWYMICIIDMIVSVLFSSHCRALLRLAWRYQNVYRHLICWQRTLAATYVAYTAGTWRWRIAI